MKKYFNTTGPCSPDKHYMLPAQDRCKGIISLIDREHYFVIHSARQSGKTTLLLDIVRQLNASGDYYALYCSLETVQKITDPGDGIPAVINAMRSAIKYSSDIALKNFAADQDMNNYTIVLKDSLTDFCAELDKPVVIMFDEADCLSNSTLVSFLRQLRDGYTTRSAIPFVNSLALVGMRNIRDYKGKIRDNQESLGSASPFNIAKKSLTLRNFTKNEISDILEQHTEVSGQVFSPEVTEKIWHHTQGQPWLVNAVAAELIEEILESDFSATISCDHADQAVQNIIFRRDTHIDSLLERLKEKRVQKVVEPVITGKESRYDPLDDDFQYVLDLGLLRNDRGRFEPANPVYSEVIFRTLNMPAQREMDEREYPPYASSYLHGKDRLDMRRLMEDFQQFWRENSAMWEERYQYKEAAPHLVLTAFLQRIINKGGDIARESASGRGRLDLCIHYKGRKYPVELKIRRDSKTYEDGKKQLSGYMDTLGCDEGWLVVFDQRKSVSWKKKIFWKTVESDNRQIHIVGC
ncbi:MAG: ATP-binding protein [Desulfobacterales bacterium]|nr:ATP-binding protein [Desulfobacterales bacterium]